MKGGKRAQRENCKIFKVKAKLNLNSKSSKDNWVRGMAGQS